MTAFTIEKVSFLVLLFLLASLFRIWYDSSRSDSNPNPNLRCLSLSTKVVGIEDTVCGPCLDCVVLQLACS